MAKKQTQLPSNVVLQNCADQSGNQGTGMTAPMRRSPAMKQEQIGLGQVTACFGDWSVNRVQNDLGEDLIVQVFDDGVSAGVNFYVQLKTCASISGRMIENGTKVSYSLEVKDLEHWEHNTTPVVVLVWDVSTSSGHWILVPKALKDLGRRVPKWREQESVCVHIPVKNSTDTNGRLAMRHEVADHLLPLIQRGRPLTVSPTFNFPDTTEGELLREKVRLAFEEGTKVTVPGKYISNFSVSDWFKKAYGEPKNITWLTWQSTPSKETRHFQLKAVSPTRTETLGFDARRQRGGTMKTVYLAKPKPPEKPHELRLTINHGSANRTVNVDFSIRFPSFNVHSSIDACKFLLAWAEGGSVDLILPNGNTGGHAVHIPPPNWSLDELQSWEKLLQKLSYIETKTSKFGRFRTRPGVTTKDVWDIDQLHALCTRGEYLGRGDFSVRTVDPLPTWDGGPLDVSIPGYRITVLGVTIPIEDATVTIEDPQAIQAALQKAVASGEERPKIKLKDAALLIRSNKFTKSGIEPATRQRPPERLPTSFHDHTGLTPEPTGHRPSRI